MENQNDIHISIPKPCHEDWSQMTPNEKGAFCMKCAKTVVDFTAKTTAEIKDFLAGQSGKKTCGRFTSDQLGEKPERKIDLHIPMNLLPRRLSFNNAFICALFIAFGTTLFSCSTNGGEVIGKITSVDTAATTSSITPENFKITGDTVYFETPEKATGTKNCSTTKGEVGILPLQGAVSAVPVDTVVKKDTIRENLMKLGKFKVN